MQNIVIDRPYVFHPPVKSRFWPVVMGMRLRSMLRKQFGIVKVECRDTGGLSKSIADGDGILLAPNHCRAADPYVMNALAREVGTNLYIMASRHLFEQGRLKRYLLQRSGAFSVWREGMDRESLRTAVEILTAAERPLVVFPEGMLSGTNDRLCQLTSGVSFMARQAARARAERNPPGKVRVFPIAIRYRFGGDVRAALEPTLTYLERRLSWRPRTGVPLPERIAFIGEALLGLKEMEYFGSARYGPLHPRVQGLMEHLLSVPEKEFLKGRKDADPNERVKAIRTAVLPALIAGEVDAAERARRWRLLGDVYLAQALSNYPEDYVKSHPSAERMIETVERMEEDLTDAARTYPPMRAEVRVGEPIEVPSARGRASEGHAIMTALVARLEAMLAESSPSAMN